MRSAGTFRGGECAFADELRSGDARTGSCRADQREFGIGVAGWDDVGAGVFSLRSAEGAHALTIAYTERLGKVLTDLDFCVYDKAMTTTREAGQSQASADALDALMVANHAASEARFEVTRLARQMREARKAVKLAEAAEKAADAAYIATPWSE